MSIATLLTELPLLTAGLPRAVLETLSVAGIPFRPYRSGTSFHDFLQQEPGRFVLYDSRKITSRLEAETALSYERDILDIAPESTSGIGITHNDERNWTQAAPGWLENLKSSLVAKGGLWLRIHDLPAHCEGVLFPEGMPREFAPASFLEYLQVLPSESNRVRGPHFGIDHVLGDDSATLLQPTFGCWWAGRSAGPARRESASARMWIATSSEFGAWWEYRNSLRLGLRQTATSLEITVDGFRPAARTPVLEYWWNEHVARLPLTSARLEIAQDNLVFAREPFRHPAGLFVSQGRSEVPASGTTGRHSASLLKTW